MTRYHYQSVPQNDDADGVTSAARVQQLRADGYELTGESGGSWHLRRELSADEVLAAEVGDRAAAALIAGGIPDLDTAQATPDAALAAIPGVGSTTVEKVRGRRAPVTDDEPAGAD